MTRIWLFVIAALFVQEPATTDAAIFQVRHLGLNPWLVNALWIAATSIDILAGYALGRWVQRRLTGSRVVTVAARWAEKIENFIGRRGERFAIILLGVVNFPSVNGFIASWLKFPLRNLFALIFVGDVIYWAIEWAINIGVRSYFSDPHLALYIVVALGLVLSVASKAVLNRVLKKSL